MGANGSILTGKAVIDKRMMRFTTWSTKEIMEMRTRHYHDLGGRFALGVSEFERLVNKIDDTTKIIFNEIFDTDKNMLVDALEAMGTFAMLSSMPIREKVDFVHSLYDFDDSGDISIDEMTIMLRSTAVGCGKVESRIQVPSIKGIEELTTWAFRKAAKDPGEDDIEKYQFEDFCWSNPTVKSFIEYWSGTVNQAVLGPHDKWTDPFFRPSPSSLYRNVLSPPMAMMPGDWVSWLRPAEFCPGAPKLYSDGSAGTTAGAIRRGQIADVWFLNALALVSAYPDILKQSFVCTQQEHQGRYCLQFFKEESWRNVVIDDFIPCDPLGRPVVAHTVDPNELWAMLIEKAYASLHGCYEALIHGSVSYALRDLTSGSVTKLSLRSPEWQALHESGELWNRLKTWCDSGYLIGAMRTEKPEEPLVDGVQCDGIHAILAAVETTAGNLVQMRNPWEGKSFNGKWSPGTEEWEVCDRSVYKITRYRKPDVRRTSTKNKYNQQSHNGGDSSLEQYTFWIVYEDMVRIFDCLYTVNLHSKGESRVKTVTEAAKPWSNQLRRGTFPILGGGSPNNPSWVQNPQYQVQVAERSLVEVFLTQQDKMFHNITAPLPIGLLVYKFEWGSDLTLVKKLDALMENSLMGITQPFQPTREVSLQLTLNPGKYVIIPMCFHAIKDDDEYEDDDSAQGGPQGKDAARDNTPVPFWLSVFSQSMRQPLKLYSADEVEIDDHLSLAEGVTELEEDSKVLTENQVPGNDPEPMNATLALEALSSLVGDMWVIVRALQARKEKLSAKVEVLLQRAAAEAAEAAAAAALEETGH